MPFRGLCRSALMLAAVLVFVLGPALDGDALAGLRPLENRFGGAGRAGAPAFLIARADADPTATPSGAPFPGPGTPGYPPPVSSSATGAGMLSSPVPYPWPSQSAPSPSARSGGTGQEQTSTVVLNLSVWQLSLGAVVGLAVGFILGRRRLPK